MHHSPIRAEAVAAADQMIEFATAWRKEDAGRALVAGNLLDDWPSPFDDRLRAGDFPAPTTIAGAVEAVRMAAREAKEGKADPVIQNLLSAAVGFLDAREVVPCPVQAVALQVVRLINAGEAAQEAEHAAKQAGDEWLGNLYERRAKAIYEAHTELEDAATYLRAESAVGALFQVALLNKHGETLNPSVNVICKRQRLFSAAAIGRLSYSLCSYIERGTGLSASDIGLDYWLGSEKLDFLRPALPTAEEAA